jgi:hypothetical protein
MFCALSKQRPEVDVRRQPGGLAADSLIFSNNKSKRRDRLRHGEDMDLYMAIRMRTFPAYTLSNRLSELVNQEDFERVIKPIN